MPSFTMNIERMIKQSLLTLDHMYPAFQQSSVPRMFIEGVVTVVARQIEDELNLYFMKLLEDSPADLLEMAAVRLMEKHLEKDKDGRST